MPRRGRKRGRAETSLPAEEAADEPQACAICMQIPPAGQGAHHCTTCAPNAWAVCLACEESFKGKLCPICRADYMREPSEWEVLPPDTTELQLTEQPSQAELIRLADRFPNLVTLEISPEYKEEPDELDFAKARFPALKTLSLTCVGLKSITFTAENTPMLEQLSLSNILGEVCPFHLALPRLRHLFAEHTHLGERYIDAGQFGLSLSRCPRLETIDSYKFRCLGDVNYAVLPSLTSISLHRSECTTHLDILYAPKLKSVSLQAAYDLGRGFRLRNLPSATVQTVEGLLAAKADAVEKGRAAAQAEDSRWRDHSNRKALTREARRLCWIDRDEQWQVAAEPPTAGDDDLDDDMLNGGMYGRGAFDAKEEVLREHCCDLMEKTVEKEFARAEAALLGASLADSSLPRVTIDTTNMDGFCLSNLEPQVRSRCKVRGRPPWACMPPFPLSGSESEGDEESESDDEEEVGLYADPREQFLRMMMATGMPPAIGLRMMLDQSLMAMPAMLGLVDPRMMDPRMLLQMMMMMPPRGAPGGLYSDDDDDAHEPPMPAPEPAPAPAAPSVQAPRRSARNQRRTRSSGNPSG